MRSCFNIDYSLLDTSIGRQYNTNVFQMMTNILSTHVRQLLQIIRHSSYHQSEHYTFVTYIRSSFDNHRIPLNNSLQQLSRIYSNCYELHNIITQACNNISKPLETQHNVIIQKQCTTIVTPSTIITRQTWHYYKHIYNSLIKRCAHINSIRQSFR